MMIRQMKFAENALSGKKVLFTGGGGGIGFEAAKALAYMGATVIIAEIDKEKGMHAAEYLKAHFPNSGAEYYEIDLSREQQIRAMRQDLTKKYGFIDVLFHNACVAPIGTVEGVPLETWQKSYRVNFEAPLLLTQLFLPEMKKRNSGVLAFVPSSGAAPYMGAYEVFKTAQVELCNTLAGELEGTGIFTYAIGPGLVKTQTAMDSIQIVANNMGMGTEAFYRMNGSHILSAEEAGCGFALSVLRAEQYNGQEIGSIQVLADCGLINETGPKTDDVKALDAIFPSIQKMITVYQEQYAGWMSRNIFEKQWVLRDFKKTVGMSAE